MVWGFTFVAEGPEEAMERAAAERRSNADVPPELVDAIACAARAMPPGKRIRVYAFSGAAPDGAVLNVSTA